MKTTNFFNKNISLLGMGAMRLPLQEDNKTIDIEKCKVMIDKCISGGINYFDTAYIYHDGKSEDALKQALVTRHKRENFYIADKMAVWEVKENSDYERMFLEQLDRLGINYFDFYLLHSLDNTRLDHVENTGGWEFAKKVKADGRAKTIGFSFHDKPSVLEEILKNHPEMEFVQLQINYMDWDNMLAKECYEIARKYGKPIIVMEPVKGGTLVNYPDNIEKILRDKRSDISNVDWAFKFVASLEGVMTILSGMSNEEQLEQNLSLFKTIEPLEASDYDTIKQVLDELSKLASIACTGCKYCIDCPKQIDIPKIFNLYNEHERNKAHSWNAILGYKNVMKVKADVCVECGKCEKHCPQSLKIIENLKLCHETLSK